MKTTHHATRSAGAALSALILLATAASAMQPTQMVGAPDRGPDEGEGPYDRLIIRGATVIDGTGAPPIGPMDIIIEGNRIVDVVGVGVPRRPIDEERRPGLTVEGNPDATVREIDASGMYVLPGFVDLHLHTGGVPKAPEAEYTYKLWMSHGITTGRGVGFGPYDWTIAEKARSAANEIVAPRMWAYPFTGAGGEGWDLRVDTPENARAWVRYVKETGGDGLKLGAHRPEIMEALLDEAASLGMGSTAHLNQMGVAQMNAIDAARLGLGTVTHFYGLFESLYRDYDVQPWPPEMNYNDEQHRFGQVPMQWNLIHERGSPEWHAFLEEMLSYDVTLDPTMTAYQASWDVDDQMYAPWHENYTLPTLWEFYEANREDHGSYYFDWTTWEEVAWRDFLEVWHDLLNDYKNMGGRVTASSDAGYIYNLMGFSTIQEMELLPARRVSSPGGDPRRDHARGRDAVQADGPPHRVRRGPGGPAGRPRDRGREPDPEPQGPVRDGRAAPQRRDGRGGDRGRHPLHDQGRHRLRREAVARRRRRDGRGTEARHDHRHRQRKLVWRTRSSTSRRS
ncbi:amidohydrolase family protein [Candidatus Palauibacter sp.]|uniref:amidohydrolase family protein n=1 Tax=Candidatus Palauibacter sp. TaxID=3101350 RepID=UPI003AF2CCC7